MFRFGNRLKIICFGNIVLITHALRLKLRKIKASNRNIEHIEKSFQCKIFEEDVPTRD